MDSADSFKGKPLLDETGKVVGRILDEVAIWPDGAAEAMSKRIPLTPNMLADTVAYLEQLKVQVQQKPAWWDRMVFGKWDLAKPRLIEPPARDHDYVVDTLAYQGPLLAARYKRAVILANEQMDLMAAELQAKRKAQRKLRYLLRTAQERGYISPRLAKRIRKTRTKHV